ncbi:MAG: DegV family protein [Lachnospiraceae bacterium]|nr:DegV family protein [Lachnospiraceae bacterium]
MVKIISDSTCDLSQDLIEKYDISVLPLHIILGEEDYLDGKSITPDEIYKWSDENNTTPKTSAVSIEEAIDAIKPSLDAGMEVVVFTIAGGMSTTNNVFHLAVNELEAEEKVRIIDSANLSTGVGLQVIEAASMAQEGKSLDEIVAAIGAVTPKVRASFVVDTLTYLHRGGRCSGLAALAGGVLKLHPKIVVKDGVMGAEKKYRGKMNSVILNYVKDMEADLLQAKPDRVFITHSGCPQETIDSVKQYLESLHKFDEILVTRAGGVVSSHCGPGTLGVLFIEG